MNITNETRRESYIDIQPKRRVRYEEILDRLDEPKTAKEIAIELYDLEIIPSTERNYTAPRLTELEKRGIVRVIGKRKCKQTGKMVSVYEKVNYIDNMISENENNYPSLY